MENKPWLKTIETEKSGVLQLCRQSVSDSFRVFVGEEANFSYHLGGLESGLVVKASLNFPK